MDHLGRGGGRMVARYADDRAIRRKVREQSVDLLDGRPLAARILRVPGFVDPFVVHVDERVAGVEPLRNERSVEACLDRLEAQAPAEAAQEKRLRRERAVDPVPLAETRQ